ncbi:MAG: IS66 family transposase [Zavarzinella sp.]
MEIESFNSECPGCQQLLKQVHLLQQQLMDQQQIIQQQQKTILALEARIRDLEDKLKPPNKQEPAEKEKLASQKPTGRKRGAQHGHKANLRKPLPPESVDSFIKFVPETCSRCHKSLVGCPNLPEPRIHQQVELPQQPLIVTQYEGHSRKCADCGHTTAMTIPAEYRNHCTGPRLTAALLCMVGQDGLSKRSIERTCKTIFGIDISLGTISNLEAEAIPALDAPYEEAREKVKNADVKGFDETGWKEAGHKRWLWTAIAAKIHIVVFLIHARRNIDALKAFMGEALPGFVSTDRWKVYVKNLPEDSHQLCWAHLKRNWEALSKRSKRATKLVDHWLELHKEIFELWHIFTRDHQISRQTLQQRMKPLKERVRTLLKQGQGSKDQTVAGFCERVAKVERRLWLFVDHEHVPPTNNDAERVQRRAVLWRRRSFGSQSARGCRFAERILTVCETLKLQGRNVLDYLEEAINAHRKGKPAPKLATT